MTTLQQTEPQQKKMIPKETVAAVVMEKQKETLELPPIQPIQMAEKVTRAAVEVLRIVEMPPIEQISTTVAIPPLESPEQPVELPPVRPVQ